MAKIEDQLKLLAEKYGRHLYIATTGDLRFGFAERGYSTKAMYATLQEAISSEAGAIREAMVRDQATIARLEHMINERLVHIGTLEIG